MNSWLNAVETGYEIYGGSPTDPVPEQLRQGAHSAGNFLSYADDLILGEKRSPAVIAAALGLIPKVIEAGVSPRLAEIVHRATLDFYRSLSRRFGRTSAPTHVLIGALYSLQYDLMNDFKPIALLAEGPLLITARKTMAANDLKDLIAWLRRVLARRRKGPPASVLLSISPLSSSKSKRALNFNSSGHRTE
jgi:hypothetical protein